MSDAEKIKMAGLEPNVIEDNGILIGSLGLFVLWGGLLAYALFCRRIRYRSLICICCGSF